MANHTPGPWKLRKDVCGTQILDKKGASVIAEAYMGSDNHLPHEANARLIAGRA